MLLGEFLNHDLVRSLQSIGLANVYGQFKGAETEAVVLAQATATLTAAQSGTQFVCAVDAVLTLPAAAVALRGVYYEVVCGALSTGTGLSISPAAADGIRGAGLTSVVNKDLINTGATDVLNDMVRIECSGVTGIGAWTVTKMRGIWAKEG